MSKRSLSSSRLLQKFKRFLNHSLGKEPSSNKFYFYGGILHSKEPSSRDYYRRALVSVYREKRLPRWKEEYSRALREFYDSQVNELKKVFSRSTHLFFLKQVLKHRLVKRNSRVLSLASGLGLTELFLAKNFCPKGKVVCLDFSEKLSIEAKKFAAKNKARNVFHVVGDLNNLPLRNQRFDLVLLLYNPLVSFEFVEGIQSFLSKKGMLIAVNSSYAPNYWKLLDEHAKRIGFKPVIVEEDKRLRNPTRLKVYVKK
jgi:SAM-dependent methyltransferase